MDALELTAFDVDGDRVHDTPIFFSLDGASPSWFGSPADILVSQAGVAGFGLFATASSLGLNNADDVDALAVWSLDPWQMVPGLDYALFSLAPSSPTLWGADGAPGQAGIDDDGRNGVDDLGEVGFGDDQSPADIFVTAFVGTYKLYLAANTIGMRNTDNVDALDVETVLQAPIDSIPGNLDGKYAPSEANGDFDLNGIVNVSDLGILATYYGNLVGMKWANGDADGDEDVDVSDLGILATYYGMVTSSGPATTPEPATLGLLAAGGLVLPRKRR
jgi:hypothetical protein